MLRNFLRQSRPWTNNVSPILGRWKRNDNINRKIDLANIDNCGDRVCGDLLTDLKFSCENPGFEGSIDSPSKVVSALAAKSLIKKFAF